MHPEVNSASILLPTKSEDLYRNHRGIRACGWNDIDGLNSTYPYFFPQKMVLFLKNKPKLDSKFQRARQDRSTELKAEKEGVSDSL